MTAAIPVTGFEHLGLLANDTEVLAAWYRDMFGAVEVLRSADPSPVIFLEFGGGALLELVPASPEDGPDGGTSHFCLSVQNIEAAISATHERGIEQVRPPFEAFDGSKVAFYRDPEGNVVQLVQRVPGSPVHRAVYDSIS